MFSPMPAHQLFPDNTAPTMNTTKQEFITDLAELRAAVRQCNGGYVAVRDLRGDLVSCVKISRSAALAEIAAGTFDRFLARRYDDHLHLASADAPEAVWVPRTYARHLAEIASYAATAQRKRERGADPSDYERWLALERVMADALAAKFPSLIPATGVAA